jgi:6-pyruvoyltetrahydropterin/6-carboxytetrahydropterin synthase
VTVQAIQGLNDLGMVVDFSCIKNILGAWIDEHWDHNMLLHPNDMLAKLFRCDKDVGMITPDCATFGELESDTHEELFAGKAPFIMPADLPNPTAENIAQLLRLKACELLTYPLHVARVRVYETPNCWADSVPLFRPYVGDPTRGDCVPHSVNPKPTPQSDSNAKAD